MVQVGRRLRHRFFGRNTPHWAKDLVRLARFVNVLNLLPTLHALLFHQSHFFKSIPAILEGKKPYYVSPLGFLSSAAAVEVACYLLLIPDDAPLLNETFLLINLIAVVLSPAAIVSLCILVIIFAHVAENFFPFGEVMIESCFNSAGARVTVDFRSYISLDRSRFVWSLCYYYVYFLVVVGAVTLLVSLTLSLYVHPNARSLLVFMKGKLGMTVVAGLCLIGALVGYWCLVRPYAFLLVHCSRARSAAMRELIASEQPPPSSLSAGWTKNLSAVDCTAKLREMGYTVHSESGRSWQVTGKNGVATTAPNLVQLRLLLHRLSAGSSVQSRN